MAVNQRRWSPTSPLATTKEDWEYKQELNFKNGLLNSIISAATRHDWDAIAKAVLPYAGKDMATVVHPVVSFEDERMSPRGTRARNIEYPGDLNIRSRHGNAQLTNTIHEPVHPASNFELSLDPVPERASSAEAGQATWPSDQFENDHSSATVRFNAMPTIEESSRPSSKMPAQTLQRLGMLELGQRVWIVDLELTKRLDKRIPKISNSAEDSGVWEGHVRYLGSVHFAEGEWVGVELNNRDVGRNNGTVHLTRYFRVSGKRNGVILPTAHVFRSSAAATAHALNSTRRMKPEPHPRARTEKGSTPYPGKGPAFTFDEPVHDRQQDLARGGGAGETRPGNASKVMLAARASAERRRARAASGGSSPVV